MTTGPANNSSNLNWVGRGALIVAIGVAVAIVWYSNKALTERFIESTRNRAEVRQQIYSGNLLSELRKNSIVPLLLSRDPSLIGALNSKDYSQTSQRLISYVEEIGSAAILLLDAEGRAVASTDRNLIGSNHQNEPYYVEARRAPDTIFTTVERDSGAIDFIYSRKIEVGGIPVGIILVEVDLRKFETTWAGTNDAVVVLNSEGVVILATEPRWRGKTEAEALAARSPATAIERAVQFTTDWAALPPDTYVQGEAVIKMEGRVPFRGWRISTFTTYSSVRERVNGVLALEIMAFAILLAFSFYVVSRRATSQAGLFKKESADLRALNAALEREITERRKAEASLEVAEQTIAQSSKLAALGEMSAAVSHELNQPLAAMKTYLAGARLLLSRKRAEEALSSFQRIDDLIDRMGAITRQLKSYARKSDEVWQPVDLRRSVNAALSMMEPQLNLREIHIEVNMPTQPVMAEVDSVRLEQVLINLLRNALDATKSVKDPKIEVLVAGGDHATVSVRDNGAGIADLDNLFEPFYTTKSPGDGVGLGLAISSGIVTDFGGRLTARNGRAGGAVFEVSLPILNDAAELAA
ncbi:ATP-binding protein [Aliiroseovarius sp. PTFE2010]|uniref:ATP-binding protein n=1 Tax=Aliiroseovarius sp. PTFE2010 TaxID=3417190 RepID=UPI003CECE343